MNILYINHYAGSNELGMEFRPYYLAREWVKQGNQVTIVAGDYSHLRKQNPNVTQDFQEQMIEGIRYLWVKTGQYQGNGAARALSMIRFVAKLHHKAKTLAKRYQPDIIITSSTYPIDTYAGQRIKKFSANAKLIHEIHDMWPATLIEIGNMSPKHPFVKMMAMGEKSFCKHADAVISYLPFTKEYLVEKGLAKHKWFYIPNGVVLTDWEQKQPLPPQHLEKIKAFSQDKKHLVGYFGGHALSNHLSQLLDVAKISDPSIGFVLMGEGVEKAKLIEKAQTEQIKNVLFLDAVSKLAVPSFLEIMDSLFIGGNNSPLYRFGGSLNKMYDALYSGKPIILAMNLPGNPIEDAQGKACIVTSGQVDDIKQALETAIAYDEATLTNIRHRSLDCIKTKYNYLMISKQYEEILMRKQGV